MIAIVFFTLHEFLLINESLDKNKKVSPIPNHLKLMFKTWVSL
jgi:hypothetical protein